MRRFSFFLLGLAFALLANPGAHAAGETLLAQQRYDRIVNSVGYRLIASAGDLCADPVPLTGFLLHDLSQYSPAEQAEARRTFGFEAQPLILAIAPTSPAAAAGLRQGDALLAIDGDGLPPLDPGLHDSYARLAAILTTLDAAAIDGRLVLEIRRAGALHTIAFDLARGCASRFQTRVSAAIDAKADGRYVEVNTGLIDFAQSEQELAGVIAHELAHNILRHRARLDAAGVRRGILGSRGRSARLTRQCEEEADRLGVYLMERAGYPPDAIIGFWARIRERRVLGFLRARTHMSESDRIGIVAGEVARIEAMRRAGQSPRPAFMMKESLPELR